MGKIKPAAAPRRATCTSHRTARARARARRQRSAARGPGHAQAHGGPGPARASRPPIVRAYLKKKIADNFAGGGGASLAIELALGRSPDVAVNHDAEAIAMHAVNHPTTKHYTESVYAVDPVEACGGEACALAWFSPDCKHHSKAKGGEPRDQKIRGLAWIAVTWAARVAPDVIVLENVEEFVKWGPLHRQHSEGCWLRRDEIEDDIDYKLRAEGARCSNYCKHSKPIKEREGETFRAFVNRLRRLGYVVEWKLLRACDYGAPTTRRRLFLVARRDGKPVRWPKPTHGKAGSGLLPYRTAAECINWSIPCPSIFGRKKPLADKTLARIARGIKRYVLESGRPFVVPVNHGGVGRMDLRVHSVDDPLPTVTGGQRGSHAIVEPVLASVVAGRYPEPPLVMTVDERPARAAELRELAGELFRASTPCPMPAEGRAARVLWAMQAHPNNASVAGISGLLGIGARSVKAALKKLEAEGLALKWIDTTYGSAEPIERWVACSTDPEVAERQRELVAKTLTLAAPFVTKFQQNSTGQPMTEPLHTAMAGATRFGVAVPYMVHLSNGERPTQAPRIYDINEPVRTVVAQGVKQGLCEATLARVGDLDHAAMQAAAILKHYGGNENKAGGTSCNAPFDTVTSRDHHSVMTVGLAPVEAVANVIRFNGENSDASVRGQDLGEPLSTVDTSRRHGLIASHLIKMRGTSEAHLDASASGMDELIPTISAQGQHIAKVTAFLLRYNGTAVDGQAVNEALGTVTSKPRFGLVTVTIDGEEYAIVDIGMRMLEPRELFNAQGFPPDYVIDLTGPNGKPLTKTAQIRMCGNSVSPPVGAAVVAAQFEDDEAANDERFADAA